jgi:hypothetical protein
MNIADRYRLDGPHTPESVTAAAADIQHLVHYLTRATRHRHTLAHPADAAKVIGALDEAVSMLPQLFNQAANAAGRWVDLPGLCDDRGGDPAVVVADAKAHLNAARDRAQRLGDPLTAAHQAVLRLGVETPKGNP